MAQLTTSSLVFPPPVPPVKDVALNNYLQQFSLWVQKNFASTLSGDQGEPQVMLQANDAPAGTSPKVFAFQADSNANAWFVPIALGSGAKGTPIRIGPSDTSGFLPLTGGTLTGPLAGTSATFSSTVSGARGNFNGAISGLMGQVNLAETGTNNNALICWYTSGFATRRGYIGLVAEQLAMNNDQYSTGFTIGSAGTSFTGAISTTGTATFVTNTNILNTGIGFSTNISGATANHFALGWNTIVAGLAQITVDNGGAKYSLANGSDERMKEDIQPSQKDCLATLLEIPLKQFRWKEFEDSDPWKLKSARAAQGGRIEPVGIIAQEVHRIFPEGIRRGDSFEDHLGTVWDIDRNAMISLLIGAVQQLTARVEELEKDKPPKP